MDRDYPTRYALTSYRFDGNAEDYLVGKLIFKHMKGYRILDLGCGPTEPIMSVFYPKAREVVAVDMLQSNLDFAKHSQKMDRIVQLAKRYRQGYLSRLQSNPRIRYVKGDVTRKMRLGQFDSVMQIGCFGTLKSEVEFQFAVDNTYGYLRKGGTLLMVNWIERSGVSLDCSKLYVHAAERAGFTKVEAHSTSVGLSSYSRKQGYSRVAWAVARKQ